MPDTNLIAEVVLSHPALVLTETTTAVPTMQVVLESQTIAAGESYYLFFEVSGEEFPAFEAALDDDPTIIEWTVIVDGDTFKVYRMLLASPDQLVLPQAAAVGLRVLHAESRDGGWVVTIQTPDTEALSRFRTVCADHGVTFRLERLYAGTDESAGAYGLTPVQLETLVTAYELGYFQVPRAVTVEELATELSVSPSAVSGRLRRGLNALVSNTVGK